ncbi:hypothetical protein PLICRDRAFT_243301 [Plicaturopsis crispa FD-325 SS-3]|nr:hypothetical protein PLICRDRAFT_243301 [Plicaturopsis crispa FD-325 SS-3]
MLMCTSIRPSHPLFLRVSALPATHCAHSTTAAPAACVIDRAGDAPPLGLRSSAGSGMSEYSGELFYAARHTSTRTRAGAHTDFPLPPLARQIAHTWCTARPPRYVPPVLPAARDHAPHGREL